MIAAQIAVDEALLLLKIGFLARTPSGRKATEVAYRHLGLTPPPEPAQKVLGV